MRYIGVLLFFICIISCKHVNKPIVHLKVVDENLYRSFDMAYEKIYGSVQSICDSGFSYEIDSGKRYKSLDWVILCKFDNRGNETEADGFDDDNVFKCKTLYTYNSNGKLERQYYYKPINDSPLIYVYNYDEKGHATGYNLYIGNDGKVDSKSVDSLDSKGNAVQNCLIEQGKMTLKSYAKVYDARGKMTSGNMTNFIETWAAQFKYDDSGNLIEQITKRVNKNATDSFDYKYLPDTFSFKYVNKDAYGNWLKKSIYKNGALKNITRRKIIYY